jgi:outer membrane protein assembly factor BamB
VLFRSAATGKKLWSFRTGGRISSPPTAGEGLILIGSNDGALYAFEPAPK